MTENNGPKPGKVINRLIVEGSNDKFY